MCRFVGQRAAHAKPPGEEPAGYQGISLSPEARALLETGFSSSEGGQDCRRAVGKYEKFSHNLLPTEARVLETGKQSS